MSDMLNYPKRSTSGFIIDLRMDGVRVTLPVQVNDARLVIRSNSNTAVITKSDIVVGTNGLANVPLTSGDTSSLAPGWYSASLTYTSNGVFYTADEFVFNLVDNGAVS